MMDDVFGYNNLINEIIWLYSGAGRGRKSFAKKHDTIYWYKKGKDYTFNEDEARVPYVKGGGAYYYLKTGKPMKKNLGKGNIHQWHPNPKGKIMEDYWNIPIINPMSKERVGYATQKPKKLLKRIIKIASKKGDTVLDPFAGSGTTCVVGNDLDRKTICIDKNPKACKIMEERVK